jgi:hypothetical protein
MVGHEGRGQSGGGHAGSSHMPVVELTNEEKSGEAGNLYTRGADADRPGGRA